MAPPTEALGSVLQWTPMQVSGWLGSFIPNDVIASQKIDGAALLELDREDVEDDLGLTDPEQIEVLLANIENLKQWERQNQIADMEADIPIERKEPRWTTYGPLYSPGVLIMGNNDHDGRPNEYGKEDTTEGFLFALTHEGGEIFQLRNFDLAIDVGRDHSLVVDPENHWIYASENAGNCIRKRAFDGRVLSTLNDEHGPMAIDPATNYVWVATQSVCMFQGSLKIYDPTQDWKFRLVKEIDVFGRDIIYDAESECMWVMGKELLKIKTSDYEIAARTEWGSAAAMVLDVEDLPDLDDIGEGCVWTAEDANGAVGKGHSRLCKFSPKGDLLKEWVSETMLGEDGNPMRIIRLAADLGRMGVWCIRTQGTSDSGEDDIQFVDRQTGELGKRFGSKEKFDGRRLDNLMIDMHGSLWVTTYDNLKGRAPLLHCLDPENGTELATVPLPSNMTISWMSNLASTEDFASDMARAQCQPLELVDPTPVSGRGSGRDTSSTLSSPAAMRNRLPSQMSMASSVRRPPASMAANLRAPSPVSTRSPSRSSGKKGSRTWGQRVGQRQMSSMGMRPQSADWGAEETDIAIQRVAHLNNVGQLPITDRQLRDLFEKYDADGSGFLSRKELNQIYSGLYSFGLNDSRQFEQLVEKYGTLDDGRVTFDEFAIIMLKVVQR